MLPRGAPAAPGGRPHTGHCRAGKCRSSPAGKRGRGRQTRAPGRLLPGPPAASLDSRTPVRGEGALRAGQRPAPACCRPTTGRLWATRGLRGFLSTSQRLPRSHWPLTQRTEDGFCPSSYGPTALRRGFPAAPASEGRSGARAGAPSCPEGGPRKSPLLLSISQVGSGGGLQPPRAELKSMLKTSGDSVPRKQCGRCHGQQPEHGVSDGHPCHGQPVSMAFPPYPTSSQGYLGHGGSPLGPAVQAAASQLAQGQPQLRWAWARPGVQVLLTDLGGNGGSPGICGQTRLQCGLGAFQSHPGLLSLFFNEVLLWDRSCELSHPWAGMPPAPFPRLSSPIPVVFPEIDEAPTVCPALPQALGRQRQGVPGPPSES